MALEFQINLGGNFASVLHEVNQGLGETKEKLSVTDRAIKALDHLAEQTSAKLNAIKADPKKFQQIVKAEKELAELQKELAGGDSFSDKLKEVSELKFGGFTVDLVEGLRLAGEMAEKLVDGVVDLGKEIVKTAGDTQDLDLAINLDVGEEGGEKVDALAESFKNTRFSPKVIKEALLPILEESGDEHSDQWNDLVTAATDVATRRHKGVAGAQTALEALRSIEIQPQRIRGALKDLGIKQKDFYSDLGGAMSISADAAEKQVKAGKVKADRLLNIALHQIAEREGGSLGNATNEGSKTLGATLDRLSNLKENLFEGLAHSPGMEAVNGFLQNFIETMEGPIGQDLVQKLSDAFATLFGDLSGPDGLGKMEDTIGGIAKKIEEFIDDFRNAWPDIKSGAEGVWDVMKGIGQVVGMVVQGWREIFHLVREFKRLDEKVAVSSDAVNDFSPQWKKDRAAGIGAMSTASAPAPADFAADQSLPHYASGGIVTGPTIALIGEDGPEAVVPLSGGTRSAFDSIGRGGDTTGLAGAQITYAPRIEITAGGSAEERRELVEDLTQRMRSEFVGILEELGVAA